MCIDNSALKHFLEKKDAKPHLIQWILLQQKFDLEIKDKAWAKNVVADNFSRLIVDSQEVPLNDVFPDKHILAISTE